MSGRSGIATKISKAKNRPAPYTRDGTVGTPLAQGLAQSGTVGTREQSAGRPEKETPEGDKLDKFEEVSEEKAKKRSFIFTVNNPQLNTTDFLEMLRGMSGVEAVVFQHEVGENGTPHYQGYMRFKNARLFGPLCTQLGGWVRPCNNDVGARKYCSKNRTRIAGPFGFGCPEAAEEIKTIDEKDFYEWEKELVSKLDGPASDRSIIWRWSKRGNVGKTSFCKWLVVKRKAYLFNGKAADVKGALADMQEEGKRTPDILIWDIPRTQEQYVSYQALEEVKNGMFFSGKFHGQMVTFNPRHVVVFANFEPDRSKMSEDRWDDVKNIDKEPIEEEFVNSQGFPGVRYVI